MLRPASRTSVLSPFSVSSLAAQPPVIPEPTTIASYAVPAIFFSSGLFEICERHAAMQSTGDDFFAQFLLETHLGRVIAGESQTLERFEEAVTQWALSFVSGTGMQIPRVPFDGRGLVQIPEEILLLGLRALDKVFLEEFVALAIDVREAIEELLALFVAGPVREDEIYEFVDVHGLCAGRVGLRNDQVAHPGHGCVLVRTEGAEHIARSGMGVAKESEEIRSEGRQDGSRGNEFQGITPLHSASPDSHYSKTATVARCRI